MRAGSLSTVQQTLTPEAAAILNQSLAEAAHRNHGQTTPLHVAATLLASPSGYLRQACIRSHPNSSHPLQCRALELCFSVALDRLPTTQNLSVTTTEPPISNALMAALKRAQAHQRRGCPEQQQQPLLAVKVVLEQLIISILDDPSVSRVMREASFLSPAVKATIEQSLNNSNSYSLNQHQLIGGNVNSAGFGPPRVQLLSPATTAARTVAATLPNRNIYLNPRLQQGVTRLLNNQKDEEVNKVLEIMGRSKKKNPVLVGDSEPQPVVKELLRKIANKELENNGVFTNLQVLSLDKDQIANKITELEDLIESKIRTGGVILDMGDLKWLVEHPPGATITLVSEMGKTVVAGVAKLIGKFSGSDNGNKLWLIGTATCETYLRCQVHHPTMESDWDLQAIPITSRSPPQSYFTRLEAEKTVSNPNLLKKSSPRIPFQARPVSENMDPTTQSSVICSVCTENYNKELKKQAEIEKSFSDSREEASSKPTLPQWLQSATEGNDKEFLTNQMVQQLHKKWRDTCLHLHVDFHRNTSSFKVESPAMLSMGLCSPNLLSFKPFELKVQANKPLGEALQLNMNQLMNKVPNNCPGSPVVTELALGREKRNEDHTADLLRCISSELQTKRIDTFAYDFDADTYKKLHKELMQRAWWQPEAASAVASVITRFRIGDGKQQRNGSRGDLWLLFTGPERVGKKKMASVVSEQICGSNPIVICLGKRRDEEDHETNVRGKTVIDRIAEAVRRNPFSVIMLEDIDEADMLVRGSIKRAIDRGRLTDSHGRESGLGNAIIIVTGDWSTMDPEALREGHFVDEKRLATVAGGSWQLGLILRDKGAKRGMSWIVDEDAERPLKPSRETGFGTGTSISLDLNLAASSYTEDEKTDNSSEVTIDQDDELHFSITSVPQDLASNMDELIVFKPVESSLVRREIRRRISTKFISIVDENILIEIGDDVLEKILGGIWHDITSLDEWIESVVKPSFEQLKVQMQPVSERRRTVVRLVVESDCCVRGKIKGNADWLPKSVLV